MIPTSAGFENECSYYDDPTWSGPWPDRRPKVAAIVNWFGITDVNDLLQGPHIRAWAVSWFGSEANREDLARRLSPLTYVRAGQPPVFTVHGDADTLVPHEHAVRLHEALEKAGVRNQLFTIHGGGHGNFTAEESVQAFEAIHKFLKELDLLPGK
jgi:dipeptidyl aminopeptidase/acylaminoacyl peptidase